MKRIFSALLLSLCVNLSANDISNWSSPPEVISTSGVNASDPHVKMDANGNVVGIWLENDVVVSKSHLLNADWGSLTTISNTGASNPHLVVDPAGNATAIWLESGVVKTATMPFGSSWGAATTLSASGSSAPQIAVDPSGNLVAVWVTGGVIESSTQLFGGSWSLTNTLSTGTASDSPSVSIGTNGTVTAIWHSVNAITSIDNINSASMQISVGTWSAISLVSNPSTNSVKPKVAVDPNGTSVATWFTYVPSGLGYADVYAVAAAMPQNGSWSGSINLSAAGLMDPNNLTSMVMVGNDNTAMVVWTQSYDGFTFTLQSAVSDNKINVAAATEINNSLYSFAADLAENSTNEAILLYMYYDGANVIINYVESTLEGYSDEFWTNPVTISTGANNAFPRVTTGVTGGSNCTATAVWVNFDGTNTNINSSFGTGTLVSPPTSLSVTQSVNNFGVFQEYYNTISWTASTSPNLVGYVVYQNGVQIAFVNAPTVSFIDHNVQQSGATLYGVAATDDTGTQSAVVNINYP